MTNDKITQLQNILQKEYNKQFSKEETKIIGDRLMNLFNILITNNSSYEL